jgi:hypothetical protein
MVATYNPQSRLNNIRRQEAAIQAEKDRKRIERVTKEKTEWTGTLAGSATGI